MIGIGFDPSTPLTALLAPLRIALINLVLSANTCADDRHGASEAERPPVDTPERSASY
jgi:hypothetical protein